MQTFFHGWRRKAGVVSLVMALALVSAYVRSMFISDDLIVGPESRPHFFALWNGSVKWFRQAAADNSAPSQFLWVYEQFPFIPETRELGRWEFEDSWWTIPLYAFILPLTFLSAYLLLWKPRKKLSPNEIVSTSY